MSKEYKLLFVPDFDYHRDIQFEKEYATAAEAEAALEVIADYTLLLHATGLMNDHSNFGAVYKRDGEVWEEIDGDENII